MAKRNPPKPVKKATRAVKAKSSVGKNWISEAGSFIERHYRFVAAFLFGLSLVLSIIYYMQARNSPIMTFHKWENSDMAFFDSWARDIASGNWLGDKELHPYHDWHNILAAEYFTQFPDIAAKYQYVASDSLKADNAKRALINDIYKGKTFHQEPLYTYMLATTYSIFGHDHRWVYFWQFLLAAFTSVLVFLVGRQLFGALPGLIASLFVTLCGSIMVFEMVLIRTTLTNFFTVLLLFLFIRLLEKPDWKRASLFGVASGFALLGQSYLILFIVPAILWMIWIYRKELKPVAISLAVFAGTMLLTMSPLIIRNLRVGVPAFAAASHGAMAYIPMNVKNSYPMESFYVHMPTLARIRHDSEGKMIPAVIASLKTFDSFDSFWKVYKQKIGGLFMWFEIPNNINYYLYREIAPILKALPVRYYFIAPLGLAGLIMGLWRFRWKIMPYLIMTIISMVPLLIAGNMARYRTPLVIMMCLFAAWFIIEIITMLYEKKFKPAFIGIGIALLAFIYTSSITDKHQFIYYSNDFDTFYRYYYMDRLIEYEEKGDFQGYLELTTQMVNNIPDYFLEVGLQPQIVKGNEAESSRHVANFLESHLNILNFLKRTDEAAFYKDQVAILRARVADFEKRVGQQ